MNKKVANKTCSLLLIPLEKSRTNFVSRIHDFMEILNLLNYDEFVDGRVAVNLREIQNQDKDRRKSFLA
jgi:hypothetical protein